MKRFARHALWIIALIVGTPVEVIGAEQASQQEQADQAGQTAQEEQSDEEKEQARQAMQAKRAERAERAKRIRQEKRAERAERAERIKQGKKDEVTERLERAAAEAAGKHLQVRDLSPVTPLIPAKHAPLFLVSNGQPNAAIFVVEPQPSPALKTIVQELVTVIELTTGAKMGVFLGPPPPDVPAIVIGACQESHMQGIDASKLPIEGFAVKTTANRIYLVGSTRPLEPGGAWGAQNNGTAWAVADFMERLIGVRWYWPVNVGGRSLPPPKPLPVKEKNEKEQNEKEKEKKEKQSKAKRANAPAGNQLAGTLVIPPSHYTDAPVFRWREYYPAEGFTSDSWVARTGEGGGTLPRPGAAAVPQGISTIDMTVLLAGLRAGKSWPYQIDSHRPGWLWTNDPLCKRFPNLRAWTNQEGGRATSLLCYSSEDTFKFLIAGAEARWDRGQGALPQEPWCGFGIEWVNGDVLGISPFDQAVACACPACQRSMQDGGPSKHMARFVQKVCQEVHKRWPNKKVGYLPYWNYTWCSPDIDYPKNLEIRLADTQGGGHWCQPLGVEKGHEERCSLWASKTASGRIVTWEYPIAITSKTHAPIQFPHTLREYYLRRSRDSAGSFLNGHCLGEWSNHAPTLYCWMKLLWNPNLDVDAVLEEFCVRMFGAAAGQVREMLIIECRSFQGSGIHVARGDGTEDVGGLRRIFSPAAVARLAELRAQARVALKKDPVALQRLEYLTWTFDHFFELYGR